jgi:hypothetical protein
MKRITAALLCSILCIQLAAPAAQADVNVNRTGDENPMKEVAKSIIYGGMAGLVMGGAIAWASDSNSNDSDIVRYGFVTGTFVGLGMGLWWVTRRPSASAALELRDGELHAQLPTPDVGPEGRPRLALVKVRF